MDYNWNVLVLWLLLNIFVFSLVLAHSDVRTENISIDTNASISCEIDSRIKIEKVDIIRTTTQCTSSDDKCSLIGDVFDMVKTKCDNKVSCTINIHEITTNPANCFEDYGYFNFSYECDIDVLSCNFDRGECGWSRIHPTQFQWLNIKKDSYSFIPPGDHTSGCEYDQSVRE
ncbi:unnamed protein product [Mytilus coruscus]|uniref:MAM domain-containing protein n=1 Tax=Mytilus coruscus TaxID=42192 RepID=A0A6J8D4L7_MYTCO|nr:unnamed protein product [Mytilus coruscus]